MFLEGSGVAFAPANVLSVESLYVAEATCNHTDQRSTPAEAFKCKAGELAVAGTSGWTRQEWPPFSICGDPPTGGMLLHVTTKGPSEHRELSMRITYVS